MSTNRVSPEPPGESPSHSAGSQNPTTCQQEHTWSEKNEMGGKWQQLVSPIRSRLDDTSRKEIDLEDEILEQFFGRRTEQEIQTQASSGSSNTANDNTCDSSHVKKPLLVLYLSQNSIPFILERSRRKKNAFERILASCVFTEDVWIFTHAQTKDYFKKFKDERKPKNSSFFFFFYTDFKNTKQTLLEISEDVDAFLIFLVRDQEETFDNLSYKKTSVIVIEDSGKTTAQKADCPDSCKVFDISINISAKSSLCELILDIINEKKCPVQKYLQLALSWDCSEKAQEKLEEEKDFEPLEGPQTVTEKATQPKYERPAEDKGEVLLTLMEKALIEDRSEVVPTFMMKGLKLSSFLKKHHANLYFTSEENDLFKKLEDTTRDKEEGQDKIKKYVEHLLDDITKETEPGSCKATQTENERPAEDEETQPENERPADNKCSVLCCLRPRPKAVKSPQTFTKKETQPENERPADNKGEEADPKLPAEPELFLFLWALLTMKFNLAKVLLEEVKDKITTPLVACALLKAIQNRTMEDVNFQDKQEDIKKNIEDFENLAVGALNTLYEKNQKRTYRLLKRIQETEYWSNVTCWEIAEHARCRKFIAQEACQKFADVIWRGRLSLHESDDEKQVNQELAQDKRKERTCVFFTRVVYFVCAIFVIIPNFLMNFSRNKRGQAQLKHAFVQLVNSWPRDFSNPSFKFYSRWFLFNGFLLLYAYVLMVRVPSNDVQPSEIFLMIWFITLYIDELHVSFKMVRRRKNPCVSMLLLQLSILNVTNYGLGIIGIIVWFCGSSDTFLHIILCLNFVGFIIRFFHFLTINSQLGPKIFMIKRMIMEIILFFVIFLILFITYGVIKYSIDNKGEGVVNSTVVLALPVEAFWLMMGDRPEDDDASDDDPKVIFRGIVRVAYLMFTAILLINVLIAAFNVLYERINDQKQDVRKFQKFQTIVKYSNASVSPPPLIVFYLIWCLICYLKLKCGGKGSENTNMDEDDFRMVMKYEDKEKLLKWAKVTTESPKEETPKTIEELIKVALDKYYDTRKQEKEKKRNKEEPSGERQSISKRLEDKVKHAQNQAAEDTANLSRMINELKELGGSHKASLKSVVKNLESTQHLSGENTANLSRMITELKELGGSHSESLKSVVTKLESTLYLSGKNTTNLYQLIDELKNLSRSQSESLKSVAENLESSLHLSGENTANLYQLIDEWKKLSSSHGERPQNLVENLESTQHLGGENTAKMINDLKVQSYYDKTQLLCLYSLVAYSTSKFY